MAFITSLRIKNFFSIKDEVTIDFKASQYNIENNPERLFEFNGESYNKIISFYGANASGKSTVLKAIIILSNITKNQSDKDFPLSFKNKFMSLDTSSELAISFVLEINNKLEEFLYQIEFESNRFENIGIKDEKLFQLNKHENTIIIDRKNKIISNVDINIIEAIFNNIENKKSFIREFYRFESKEILVQISNFFISLSYRTNITAYQSYFNVDKIDEKDIGSFLDNPAFSKELESFYQAFFSSIGLSFYKIEAKYKRIDGKPKEFKGIYLYHDFNQNEPLEFWLESDGTQMLMKILLDIYLAKINNISLVIDELDSSVHPALVPIIINLLIENDIQIIYSTHNIYNMTFLQNDEVFLIEKDENHTTIIKPVKDNPNIKDYENILISYENGDLGGIPDVKEIITKIL